MRGVCHHFCWVMCAPWPPGSGGQDFRFRSRWNGTRPVPTVRRLRETLGQVLSQGKYGGTSARTSPVPTVRRLRENLGQVLSQGKYGDTSARTSPVLRDCSSLNRRFAAAPELIALPRSPIPNVSATPAPATRRGLNAVWTHAGQVLSCAEQDGGQDLSREFFGTVQREDKSCPASSPYVGSKT